MNASTLLTVLLISGCAPPSTSVNPTSRAQTEGTEVGQPDVGQPDVIRLVPGPAGTAADADFGALRYQLAADLIVVGTIQAVQADGSATLRVREMLRGDRAEIQAISSGGEFMGCAGNPDFASLAGHEVVMFLRRLADGTLIPLHGASSLHHLPYRDRVPLDALRALVWSEPIPAPLLAAMVRAHGPGIIDELSTLEFDFGAHAPEVQEALEE